MLLAAYEPGHDAGCGAAILFTGLLPTVASVERHIFSRNPLFLLHLVRFIIVRLHAHPGSCTW
jgi:hypothetical protein